MTPAPHPTEDLESSNAAARAWAHRLIDEYQYRTQPVQPNEAELTAARRADEHYAQYGATS